MQLHEETKRRIDNLCRKEPRNVILYGPKGLGKREQAIYLAASWIGVKAEELDTHPDYLLLEPQDGALRSEQAELIRRKAEFCPEKKAVCVVDGAELMTADLQNKLLKVLEDAADLIAIIFVSAAPLLDTVMSRCVSVPFIPFGLNQLYEQEEHSNEHMAAIMASDGCPGVYARIIDEESMDQLFTEFLSEFINLHDAEGSIKLLSLTHSLREKDREYLPEALESWQLTAFLCLCKHLYWILNMRLNGLSGYEWFPEGKVLSLYSKEKAEQLYFAAAEAVELSKRKGRFNKNDFFGLLIKMLPVK